MPAKGSPAGLSRLLWPPCGEGLVCQSSRKLCGPGQAIRSHSGVTPQRATCLSLGLLRAQWGRNVKGRARAWQFLWDQCPLPQSGLDPGGFSVLGSCWPEVLEH